MGKGIRETAFTQNGSRVDPSELQKWKEDQHILAEGRSGKKKEIYLERWAFGFWILLWVR